ncbi:MAG: sigma 54-interacting transcriptional regulator [Tissierellia bacterium]|nr:sigma 54-interacting transcriptional regulator [Tissierellia bacterium]
MDLKKLLHHKIQEKSLVSRENTYPLSDAFWAMDLKQVPGNRLYFEKDGEIKGWVEKELLLYLQKKEKRQILMQILDNIEEGVVTIDEEGRIFYANDNYSKILGVPLNRVIGKHMEDIEKGTLIMKALKNRQSLYRKNILIRSIEKYVNVKIFPLYFQEIFYGAVSIFEDVTKINQLTDEVQRMTSVAEEYNRRLEAREELEKGKIIGRDPVFLKTTSQALSVAKTDATVLILGENGTGKDILSRFIYKNSKRKDRPFILLNCAAIPENLIESEMFGYEGGSFTGAKKGGKMGKFELAHQGTIFLDEIGDMSMAMQTKLLRTLETGEIEKVGGEKKIKVDVRVIAATNQDLEEKIKDGSFRQDLYYRLSVMVLKLPTLKERGLDIIDFANHFLEESNNKYEKELEISEEVYRALLQYSWPGNVRELKNAIEHATILAFNGTIYLHHLPETIQSEVIPDNRYTLEELIRQREKEIIQNTLERNRYDRKKTIEELGLSQRTFYRKLKILEIDLPNVTK